MTELATAREGMATQQQEIDVNPTGGTQKQPSRESRDLLADAKVPLLHRSPKAKSFERKLFEVITVALKILAAVAVIAGIELLAIVVITGQSIPIHSTAGGVHSTRPRVVEADLGIVAADQKLCSDIGLDVLRKGGNAVDAAVATAFCLGVTQPESSGIGGGDFMLLRLADGHARAYDMRETAPLQSSADMYAKDPSKKYLGGLSVGVPGEVKGLYQVWKRYGTMPWRSLVQPAIRLAENGFAVEAWLALQIEGFKDHILEDESLREVFAPNGIPLREGDLCCNNKLAKTLSAIAEQGSDAFYKGPIAEAIVADVQAAGGILSMEDLASYEVKVTAPLMAKTWGHTLLGMPPPSSGGAGLTLIMNILDAFKSANAIEGKLGLHHIIEAFKHTYAVRTNLGDPDFEDVAGVVADMTSPAFARALQSTIADNATFGKAHYGGKYFSFNQGDDHGTSHFSIVDRHRNAVSMTCTVNYVFGSGLMSAKTGVFLNNEMDDFAVPDDNDSPATVNFIKPGKRPLSTMSPTIMLQNDQLRVVIGGSGGIQILTTVAQLLLHMIEGMDPVTAYALPRVHHQLSPNVVTYENYSSFDGQNLVLAPETRHFLEERGHELSSHDGGAVSQFILHDLTRRANIGRQRHRKHTSNVFLGKLVGLSDFRKDGYPAGY